MPALLTEITQQAITLPPGERMRLAEILLESLQDTYLPGMESKWLDEIERRVQAYDAGQSEAYPAEAVFAEAQRIAL